MVQLYHIFLESIFFFNDTATTEIYPYCTLCPYPTLFRSLVLTRCGHLGTVQAQWTQRNVSMRSMIWVATGLLVFGLASAQDALIRSEEHTSELQSLMRISYAVFCLKKTTPSHSHKQIQYTIYIHR